MAETSLHSGHHDSPAEIRVRAAIPGRERWAVDCIRQRPQLACRIEQALRADSDFHEVIANPVTGRILIIFNPESIPAGPKAAIEQALTKELQNLSTKEETEQSKVDSPVFRVLQRVGASEYLTVKAPLSSLMATVSSLISAWSLSELLGAVSRVAGHQLTSPVARIVTSQLWTRGIFTAIAFLIDLGLSYYARKGWREIAATTEHQLRSETFAHVLNQDMAFFDDQSTGRLLTIVSGDTANVSRLLESGPGFAIQVASTSLIVTLVLLFVSPILAVGVLLPAAGVFLTSHYFQKQIAPLYEQVGVHSSRLSQLLTNSLEGEATVKSFTAEQFEISRVRQESEVLRQTYESSAEASLCYGSIVNGISAAVIVWTLTRAGVFVVRNTLTERSFILLAQLVPRLMGSIGEIDKIFDLYRSAEASSERLLEVFDTTSQISRGLVRLYKNKVRGAIRFNRVSFHYPSGFKVFQDLSLHVDPGETIGIVGSTGAGKTTILKLLLRFYDRQGGEVAIDGRKIEDVRISDLRRAIAYVSQDVYLFDGTIYENILYGNPRASKKEVIEAARASAAHDFIKELPFDYQTVVGERGQKLSAGQRQRISIARAVIKKAPILVLDEATASLDNETEAALQRSIERIASGCSVIIIAHRLSTVRNTKRIYVIDDGRVLEKGTHQELLEIYGLYASLWSVQTGSQTDVVP